jgi:secreted PhoX family phosphatase
MQFSRRHLIAASAAGLAMAGLGRFAGSRGQAAPVGPGSYRSEVFGYGPLIEDQAGVFDLPEGFSYTVLSEAGMPMSDGFLTPHKLDGMGCFTGGPDRVRLVRNHEITSSDLDIGPFGPGRALAGRVAADRAYDRTGEGVPLSGGATTLVYDLKARRLVSDHLSLTGTLVNCAGGVTPWGSWLSCEETTQAKGAELGKDHGWVFEVPAGGAGLAEPLPLEGLGRFRHEAAAVDPRTGVVYLTEDEPDGDGLFYRFLPNDRRRLAAGGRLQALALPEGADADLRNRSGGYWKAGDWRQARWIDLDGVDNPDEDLRYRGHHAGATYISRGEGVRFADGDVFVSATSGGPKGYGQILRYRPSPAEGQPGEKDAPARIQLFCEPQDPKLLEMCDNITISPWGHVIVCEDKASGGENFLRGVTPDGRLYAIARRPGGTELAGVCFSPDGTTLFLNAYFPGTTLAVTGPWGRFRA